MIRWVWNKMMKWGWDFNRDLRNNDHEAISVIVDDDTPNMEKAIKFSVLPARGGCVMETRIYDRKEHQWDTVSHVIPDGTDVARAVGDIVALELLRR